MDTVQTSAAPTLFTLLSSAQTHIDFSNILNEGLNTNILMYEYFYNGGGVATGDFNGDDLIDIYFTSNMGENKLYLNKGNMQFQDITTASGALGRVGPWKTGVTVVDINSDNKLDLYVSYSGMVREENRANQLFVNDGNDANGIPHFTEKAEAYGLASKAFSNQAYFFDCDLDGDLDALLLNHNPKSLPILNEVSTKEMMKKDDPLIGLRLYKQNDKQKFEDKTTASGINGSALSYGLAVGLGDFNNDNWPDFYISNDYNVPDYLYINNGRGSFTNKLEECVGHNSQFSMGNDVGDINNDGLQDIITLDMLPEDNHRQKLLLAPDNYGKFDLNLRSGFYYQYMRNMLQLNNGNGTFSEVGQFSGISNTDWSWAALLADYDNDGWKDLIVTNGYYRDYTNLDFIKYMDDFVKSKGRLLREDALQIIQHMPASNVSNYAFGNNKGKGFVNETKDWGMNKASNSTGAGYADLDNDGDLDVVINNVNQPAFIYRNDADKTNHYLQLKFNGSKLNTLGIGTKIIVSIKGKEQFFQQFNQHGYLSSVSPIMHIGLGAATVVDSLKIIWPTGKQQLLTNIKADQVVSVSEADARVYHEKQIKTVPVYAEAKSIQFTQPTSTINDFKRQPLLTSQFSHSGPCMTKADVNNDGLEDVFIGGGNGQAAKLFIQQNKNRFVNKTVTSFETDKSFTDADAVFFDANNDGALDLYVASGGYGNLMPNDALLQDRIYINDGKGNFKKSDNALPSMLVSKGTVCVLDINGDNNADLFVGGRVIPGRYPEKPKSFLLIGDGHGNFTDKIEFISPSLQNIGMVTDAISIDLDNDKNNELIVVGEWLPVTIYSINQGKLTEVTANFISTDLRGWWNTIYADDINNDSIPDLLLGNLGTNNQLQASNEKPLELFYKDFDNNGSIDPFICSYIQGKIFPYVTRDEMLEQIGSLRQRFNSYQSYADVTLAEIFKPEDLSTAGHNTINTLETLCLLRGRDKKFTPIELPQQAQYAPVNAFKVLDFNHDGINDVLLCGNNSFVKLRLGKMDGNYGVLLKGVGNGKLEYVNQAASGFNIRGDVHSIISINDLLLFGMTEKSLLTYKIK
ncbi:MAG TPA: VCBS repeat-containing protein [Cyclobacteriaceae bacterium]